jgi:hypothetical protein
MAYWIVQPYETFNKSEKHAIQLKKSARLGRMAHEQETLVLAWKNVEHCVISYFGGVHMFLTPY